MQNWLIGAYATLLVALIATAGFVGLFANDHARGERALKILKVALFAFVGTSGLLGLTLTAIRIGLF